MLTKDNEYLQEALAEKDSALNENDFEIARLKALLDTLSPS